MRTSLNLEASACLLAALLILTLPLKWLFAALFAALFHEFCHVFVIILLGGQILSITIGPGGAVIETSPLSRIQELICALAGPVGSLFLLAFCHRIPRIALCAAVQAFFNLLPMLPLDGGRILRCGAELILPERWANAVCILSEHLTITGIILLSLLGAIWYDWGVFPLLLGTVLLIKSVLRKIPCKEAKLGVQ